MTTKWDHHERNADDPGFKLPASQIFFFNVATANQALLIAAFVICQTEDYVTIMPINRVIN